MSFWQVINKLGNFNQKTPIYKKKKSVTVYGENSWKYVTPILSFALPEVLVGEQ